MGPLGALLARHFWAPRRNHILTIYSIISVTSASQEISVTAKVQEISVTASWKIILNGRLLRKGHSVQCNAKEHVAVLIGAD